MDDFGKMKWTEDLRRLLRRLQRQNPEEPPPGGIGCHEALERIFEWLDNELAPSEAVTVGEHLKTCARCYPRLSFERAFREAMRRAPRGEVVGVELQQRILDAVSEEGMTTD